MEQSELRAAMAAMLSSLQEQLASPGARTEVLGPIQRAMLTGYMAEHLTTHPDPVIDSMARAFPEQATLLDAVVVLREMLRGQSAAAPVAGKRGPEPAGIARTTTARREAPEPTGVAQPAAGIAAGLWLREAVARVRAAAVHGARAATAARELRPRPRVVPALISLLVVLLLVAAGFQQAIAKKMHHTLTNTVPCLSMMIAISDLVYHLDQGYIAYKVLPELCDQRFGRGSPADAVNDAKYINTFFRDATSIDEIVTMTPSGRDDLRPIVAQYWMSDHAEDIGRVDYYRLAFRLFGYNIEGTNYLFFVFILVSALLFWVGFHDNPAALALLIADLIGYNLVIQSGLFEGNLPAVSAYRGIAALAVIPISHLLACMYFRTPFLSLAGLTGMVQAGIYTFIVWSRSSALWGAFALAFLALFCLLRARKGGMRWGAVWPLLIVVAGLYGTQVYARHALHPAYFTDQIQPRHTFWHSVYIGLALNPSWPYPEKRGDNVALAATDRYLTAARPDLPRAAPLTGNVRWRVHEQALQHLFWRFAREHPWYMVQLQLWIKPAVYVAVIRDALLPLFRGAPLVALLASILGLAAASQRWPAIVAPAVTLSGFAALATIVPALVAYPTSYAMEDSFWAMLVLLLILTGAAVGSLAGSVAKMARTRAGRDAGGMPEHDASFAR